MAWTQSYDHVQLRGKLGNTVQLWLYGGRTGFVDSKASIQVITLVSRGDLYQVVTLVLSTFLTLVHLVFTTILQGGYDHPPPVQMRRLS